MAEEEKNTIPTLGQVIPAVAKAAYSDLVSGALQEAGKIGVDALKTIRLALFPLQFTSAIQDRLGSYIQRAIAAVPEERRIAPRQALLLAISEQVRKHDESDPLTILYIRLLSRALDAERIGEAHPAFINIIAQLAPDEAMMIELLGNRARQRASPKVPPSQVIVKRLADDDFSTLGDALAKATGYRKEVLTSISELIEKQSLLSGMIAQPELLSTFIEHLSALGLIVFDNSAREKTKELLSSRRKDIDQAGYDFYCIRLNEFGHLFFRACIAQ